MELKVPFYCFFMLVATTREEIKSHTKDCGVSFMKNLFEWSHGEKLRLLEGKYKGSRSDDIFLN